MTKRNINKKIKVACIWSGGKDSCLACFKAKQKGYDVKYLFNLVDKDSNSVSFHNFHRDLIRMQSEAIGIPVFQRKIFPSRKNAEQFKTELKNLLRQLKARGIEGVIFGYILPGDLQRALAKKLCSQLNLKLIEPLYNKGSKRVLAEFIRLGFKAIIVSVDKRILDRRWVGRYINNDFLKYLESQSSVDICGDRGEYHSFVIDGPLFKKRLNLKIFKRLILYE